MHLFAVAFIISGILYALFQQRILILYFLLTVIIYIVISIVLPGARNISNRKKIMVATWQNPTQGVIQVKVPCRVQKCQEIIKASAEGDVRLTMTHFVIKAAGELVKECSDLNGKLAFGKFIPHDTIDISCLVDIDGGKDLAMLLIKQVDKKSVKQIAQFIKDHGSKIKKNKGDADHKQRTKFFDYMPAFMVHVVIQVSRFLMNKLGIGIKALAMKKHQFGAGCVTSLGMLGFEDAVAPFTGFTDCVFLVAANAVHEAPVVENGKIEVGRLMNCNFVVDHRYIDGGKAKTFVKKFSSVFENPKLFVDSCGPSEQKKQA